jgi:hypothetical protein
MGRREDNCHRSFFAPAVSAAIISHASRASSARDVSLLRSGCPVLSEVPFQALDALAHRAMGGMHFLRGVREVTIMAMVITPLPRS